MFKSLSEKLGNLMPSIQPTDDEPTQDARANAAPSYKIAPQVWMLVCLVAGYALLWYFLED